MERFLTICAVVLAIGTVAYYELRPTPTVSEPSPEPPSGDGSVFPVPNVAIRRDTERVS